MYRVGGELQLEGIRRGRFRGNRVFPLGPGGELTAVAVEGVNSSTWPARDALNMVTMGGQITNGSVLDIQESNLAILTMSLGESDRRESRESPWKQRYIRVPGQNDSKCVGDSVGERQKRHGRSEAKYPMCRGYLPQESTCPIHHLEYRHWKDRGRERRC